MKENIKYMKLMLLVIKSTLQIMLDYHRIPAASKLWHCLLNPEKMFVMFHVKNTQENMYDSNAVKTECL